MIPCRIQPRSVIMPIRNHAFRAPGQLQASHPAVIRPGLHEWPCWQLMGYDHQSGSSSSSIYLLEHLHDKCVAASDAAEALKLLLEVCTVHSMDDPPARAADLTSALTSR